jgi:hypothetical protein
MPQLKINILRSKPDNKSQNDNCRKIPSTCQAAGHRKRSNSRPFFRTRDLQMAYAENEYLQNTKGKEFIVLSREGTLFRKRFYLKKTFGAETGKLY